MELWKNHHKKPHEIEVRHDQLMGLESELLIMHEIMIYQDISLNVHGFTTWLVQII